MANKQQVRGASGKTGEFIAFDLSAHESSSEGQHYNTTGAGAFDPFAGKTTNDFAESPVVRIVADVDMHFKWGDVDVTAADANDIFLPANTIEYLAVNEKFPYMRVIGTGEFHVTEIY